MATAPSVGQAVRVRQRDFVVVDVNSSPAPNGHANGRQHLLTLSSLEDDAMGEELRVVWELEPGARISDVADLPEPTGFDDPALLDAFLDAVRWGTIASIDDQALQAPFRSGIAIHDYQLDPVARAIQMPRANLLIADDVGLGKTVEAGLVVEEFILRRRARRVLVICPSPLQLQWQDEMWAKFGLEFRIIDSAALKELRRTAGLHVNPWNHFPRLITSIDWMKFDRPRRLFQDLVSGQPTYPRKFDLLIVDEAHNAAPSGSGQYATDSLKTHLIRELAPRFEHKLFLTGGRLLAMGSAVAMVAGVASVDGSMVLLGDRVGKFEKAATPFLTPLLAAGLAVFGVLLVVQGIRG